MKLKICHLYYDLLNLYGDSGNIAALRYRLEKRGIECSVDRVTVGDRRSLAGYDLVFIGGGQDFEQELICNDLRDFRGEELRSAVGDGVTFLAVCGGYQILGSEYTSSEGAKMEFSSAIDVYTIASAKRMVGDMAFCLGDESGGSLVIGFENHAGRTFLGYSVRPLGRVIKGFGNNGLDGTEGARYNNAFCTYSHGPVLPKNPDFCDFIIRTALSARYTDIDLEPLNDDIELSARTQTLKKLGIL